MDASKLSAKLLLFLSGFDGFTAYCVILGVLLACGLGVPIPEDITLIAAGFLAGLGKISLWGALLAGFVGVMVGDAFMFFLGRYLGDRAFTLPLIRSFMTPARIELAKKKVHENAQFVCFVARFLPGLRSPTFLTAGVMGVSPWLFFALDGLAAAISIPVWVVGAWYLADNLEEALHFAKEMHMVLLIALPTMVVGYLIYKYIKKKRRPSST
tara:strand:+ start:289 stop:924 length:636 start_codon:yes stop_codon:yes gene_type:complete